jgi:hypothetical protein
LDEIRASRISKKTTFNRKRKAISHAANILGRTFEEVLNIYDAFGSEAAPDRFYVIYWLGKLAIDEIVSITNDNHFSLFCVRTFRTPHSRKFGLQILRKFYKKTDF